MPRCDLCRLTGPEACDYPRQMLGKYRRKSVRLYPLPLSVSPPHDAVITGAVQVKDRSYLRVCHSSFEGVAEGELIPIVTQEE